MSITRPIAGKDSPQRARLSDEAIDMSPMKVSVRRPPSGGKRFLARRQTAHRQFRPE